MSPSRFGVGLAALPFVFFACFAATPHPNPSATLTPIKIHPPTTKLHTEYLVEVNKMGQVVRVKSGKMSPNRLFDTETYGNALQMWIRHPDGTAEVGLYRVAYDYDPKTHHVHRDVAIVSAGGSWGEEQGAANQMIDLAHKESRDAQKRAAAQRANLPSLDQIFGATPSPTAHP